MKKYCKVISKAVLLLVLFGFFQPVACDMKGFDLAKHLMNYGQSNYTMAAYGLYLTFFAAVVSIAYTLYLLVATVDFCSKKAGNVDLGLLAAGVAGIIIANFPLINDFNSKVLNRGSYFIFAGWGISLIFLLMCSQSRS